MPYDSIEIALAAVRNGSFVVVADDAARENEGDLIIAAEKITPEHMAFMVRHTSGIVCVSLPQERVNALQLPPMTHTGTDPRHTAFTVSVDFNKGTSTGISAADRSSTVRALADSRVGMDEFARPGHIFPLLARKNGVLERPGHTEAAGDLARLAGLYPAAALSEIVNDDGRMVRGPELLEFARRHRLPIIRIADLIAYRRRTERLIKHEAEARLPTPYGVFTAHVYRSIVDGSEHLALIKGEVHGQHNVLVRVHSECLTGDVLESLRCDCGNQLKMALEAISRAGSGVLVYLRGHEGRGIGLAHKLRAYQLQDKGRDTVEANLDLGLPVDSRSYDVGAQILTDLGITTLRLMSNNPAKFTELEGYRLKIVERVPLEPEPNAENIVYLRTKSQKLGHLFDPATLVLKADHENASSSVIGA
ncbi:bifunctional 3,4-dihydroxy-2-butanone-4-phosphate synthase/GTP cyclohydrolase II [Candidatus Methylospira mobilis]|uniref:Riboflavin biosynthesis protein RibBA n=1 Tax=Candidatus Methylospira mobilis TaxID=1808979 RepID=A0A5Q0BFQ9_9GAMM|nr:bifunctional 3,4-dihydroxy-2-butanone-4-phosphate synthase/GTP cyclohydrolase II [Candidatus Methylospira mobilis]QFY42693.1 bifunctional 3,4-dihydroxy-2-butanone-4-phosphate synthase/GTP cyclohydrolase II [Candidatus Methylospira mobilis]WNV04190.1 bifunctional 3,4-dihydroxy-2-butanone-4-phosphate synthase/GTP cyclohydrolase II [Candidatus Methylospira mobilis]